jgi:hypothetical protein
MFSLPYSPRLNVSTLAACFEEVTNSYKFYWFLAILEHVREGYGPNITINSLLARMVANVWYPTNYFRLSFGKQDQLGRVVNQIGQISCLPIDSPRTRVIETAIEYLAQQDTIGKHIYAIGNYVPYRFLRPFFKQALRGAKDSEVNRRIWEFAEKSFESPNPCLYRFVKSSESGIELHPNWFDYIQRHLTILTGFCLWNLLNYIQKNNPNVPNIANKLFEPQQRSLRLAREFWNLALYQAGQLNCIYSNKPIHAGNFTLDHFLPWRFVAHDLLWNLAPTSREVNSSKSDNLPDPSYLDPFIRLQYRVVQIVAQSQQASRLLEDYIILFHVSTTSDFQKMAFSTFRDNLRKMIAPQLQIAANMGFSVGWRYAY